jgi:hypothetical protein
VAEETDRKKAAVQTFVYGYPTVYNLTEAAKLFDGSTNLVEHARPNEFAAARSPYVDPDPALAQCLVEGKQQGEATLESLSTSALQLVDSWSGAMHAFDDNIDRCGPGTIDTPEWKIADRTTAYVTRAVAARLGLWGNHGYEARYDIGWQDEHGDELDGGHAYELTRRPHRRSTPSGRSPCTTCPTPTWWRTPSTATPSATAPRAW